MKRSYKLLEQLLRNGKWLQPPESIELDEDEARDFINSGVVEDPDVLAAIAEDEGESQGGDTAAGNDQLAADLDAANTKVNQLTTNLETANSKVTQLTSDLVSANTRGDQLGESLTKVNNKVIELTTSLDAANTKVGQLETDLATEKTKTEKLTTDLATANANIEAQANKGGNKKTDQAK